MSETPSRSPRSFLEMVSMAQEGRIDDKQEREQAIRELGMQEGVVMTIFEKEPLTREELMAELNETDAEFVEWAIKKLCSEGWLIDFSGELTLTPGTRQELRLTAEERQKRASKAPAKRFRSWWPWANKAGRK